MKKILISLSIIAAVGAVAIGATTAYFSDTETSTGNTFSVGTLDLKLGAGDSNIIMFTVSDIAPGNTGSAEVALNNAGSINGYIDFNFSNLVDLDNSCVEPEIGEEPGCVAEGLGAGTGELDSNLDITAYIDENDNDVYDAGTDTLVYQGKDSSVIGAGKQDYVFNAGATKNFRIDWSIPTSVGNIIQSDSAGFDITFELGQDASQ